MIERLKQEMKRSKISALELSVRAKTGRSFVYDLLSGKSMNPTINNMLALSDALGVSLSYLATGNDNQPGSAASHITIKRLFTDKKSDITHNTLLFNRTWIQNNLNTEPENLRLHVFSDNTDNIFKKDDTILLDISCKIPLTPGIFILKSEHGLTARRIEFVPDKSLENIFISLGENKSDNHIYNGKVSDINIIGRVLWTSKTL